MNAASFSFGVKGALPTQNAFNLYSISSFTFIQLTAAFPKRSCLYFAAAFFTSFVRNTYHIAPVRQIEE